MNEKTYISDLSSNIYENSKHVFLTNYKVILNTNIDFFFNKSKVVQIFMDHLSYHG